MAASDLDAVLQWLGQRDDFVLLDTARRGPDERGSLLFLDPVVWLRSLPGDDPRVVLAEAQSWSDRGYHLAGWLAYEFGYLLEPALAHLAHLAPPGGGSPAALAVLGVFREAVPDERWEEVLGRPETFVPPQSCVVDQIRPGMTREQYLAAVQKIQDYIGAGDTYQVNLTFPLLLHVQGSPAALYRRLRDNQRVAFGAWIREGGREIMSFSPELFVRWRDGRLRTRPMKGTMRRGADLAEDARQAADLRAGIKNRAENVMIVDLLRNDLGRLLHRTGGGEVRVEELFTVETYETLLQMTSTVTAWPASGRCPPLGELFAALFPCGSVTGAPKIRTMEIIRELERGPRGVYTGAIGCIGPERTVFSVPIRTLELRDGTGRMGIGSGIVHDSDPAAEWDECLLKAQFLVRERPACRLIETLRWQPSSGYWLLAEHLERLRDSAAWLLFPCDLSAVLRRLDELAASFTLAETARRVRLTLDRDGALELSHVPCELLADPARLPDPVGPFECPVVIFARERTDAADPYLRHKTTRREMYDAARQRALAAGFYDVLFMNSRDEVTESAIANIFLLDQDGWRTPPVSRGLLPGVCRRHLLARLAAQVVEAPLARVDVLAAKAVFLVNSVRGVVQVRVEAEEI